MEGVEIAETGSESRPQRLMISNMVLENFKSYAGVQEIGPFHKSFSSIVGPNGSGKSNVIDAMLFVFGKKAKQLRLNKVSELIHRSKNYPDLQYAKVTVYFQMIYEDSTAGEADADAYEVVPDSHFVVSRVAGRDNSSKYTVDGKSSTYTEVGRLLRRVGIDLDNNRFLILQGEVEQIAMMKPKGLTQHDEGLLEYLEDIIGTNHYVEKIDAVDVRLTELNEVRASKLRAVRQTENERDNLQGAKDEAEAYIDMDREVRRKQNRFYQGHLLEASRVQEKISAECEAVSVELAAEKSRLKENDTQLKEMKKTYDATVKNYDKICDEVNKATEEFVAFERRDVKLQEDIKHSKAAIKKLQTSVEKDSKKEEESAAAAQAAREEVERLTVVVKDAEERRGVAEAALDEVMLGLKETTATMRADLEAVKEKLVDAKRAVSGIETEKEGVTQALSLSQARHVKAATALDKARAKLTSVRSQLADCDDKLQGADGKQSVAVALVESLTQEVTRLDAQETELHAQLRQAVSAAEEAKAVMQASTGRTGALAAILKAARKGGSLAGCGVRGRLGDLGSIDDKYDVAISTACGSLDNIVVDTTAGAQKCVKYLRDNNAGRASFLVLDQMTDHARRMQEQKQLPDSCPRLFDLVTTESVYQPAFYMALRDTLVAPNLDTAVSVAFQGGKPKWRVVTVDGNLVDTTGAMSGGGKSVRSGGMKSAPVSASTSDVSPAQLQELEKNACRLTAALSQCRADKATAEKNLDAARKNVKQLSHSFEKARIATESFKEQVTQLEERTSVLQEEATPMAEEMAEAAALENKLVQLEEDMCRKSPALRDLEADVDSRQKEILAVGGPQLKAAQKKLNSATKDLEDAQALSSAQEVELASATKAQNQAATARAKGRAALAETEEALECMRDERRTMEEEALQVAEAVKAAKVLMMEQEKSLTDIRGKYETMQAQDEKARGGIVDLETQVEDYHRVLNETKASLQHWRKQLAAVRAAWTEDQSEELRRIETEEAAERAAGVFVETPAAGDEAKENENENEKDKGRGFGDKEEKRESTQNGPSSTGEGAELGENNGTIVDTETPPAVPDEVAGIDDTGRENGGEVDDNGAMDVAATTEEAEDSEKSAVAAPPAKGLADLPDFDTDSFGLLSMKVLEELSKGISTDEKTRDKLKETVNLSALAEYRQKSIDYKVRLRDLEHATETRNACRKEHEDLRRQRLEAFMAGFNTITLKLKEMYQMITLGGDAELELVDSLDPFSEGIVFSVRPPKKSWKNISNLSGGEKTLSSLALVFALHHFKPTPLYVMDEIDAALDFKNVSIVANYIKERTKNAQFVIISLRNNMFELADRLVGIYKTHDATKSITINPRCFDAAVSGEPPAYNAVTATTKTSGTPATETPPAQPLGEHNTNSAPVTATDAALDTTL